eukprot:Polyplicarium_translucidae@DN3098_c1_g1_i1.p3
MQKEMDQNKPSVDPHIGGPTIQHESIRMWAGPSVSIRIWDAETAPPRREETRGPWHPPDSPCARGRGADTRRWVHPVPHNRHGTAVITQSAARNGTHHAVDRTAVITK